jgi:hypothetical protein
MSADLSPAVWREIEAAAVNAHAVDSRFGASTDHGRIIWAIELGKLRTIIKKSRRTNDQNALAWHLYEDIIKRGGEEMRGFTKDDLHEFFLINHFGAETKELFGRKRLKPLKRSSRLTKMEFADFVDHIVRFMAERGVVLELPGEDWNDEVDGSAGEQAA